jgi:uncharacterized membrane protein/protein-disulfide isomerase
MASRRPYRFFIFAGLCGTTEASAVTARARALAFVFGFVGLGAMLTAAVVHYRLLLDPGYTSFCDISSTVGCSQVYLSRFSTAYGVPVSVYGAIWFAGVLLLLAASVIGPQAVRESVPGYVFALSTAALAAVLYLIYVSIVVLKVYCVLCLTADTAVVGLFVVSGSATSFPMTTLHRRAFRDVRTAIASPLAIVVAVLFFGGAASALALFPREGAAGAAPSPSPAQEAERRSEFERWYVAQPRVPLVVPADGAKVLIVDFSDFQCPFCSQAYLSLRPIIDKFNAQQPNTVRLVMKDFPLDSKCNANVQGGGPHPSACDAAVAVRLASPAKRDALEDHFFRNQPAMTPETVRKWAREIGGVTDFDAKYAATIEGVKADIGFGHTLNVSATPTMFINGVKVAGVLQPQYLEQAIAFELKRATQQ